MQGDRMSSRTLIFKANQIAKMQEEVKLEVVERYKNERALPLDAENTSSDTSLTKGESIQINEKLEEYRDKELSRVDTEIEEYREKRQKEIEEALEGKKEEIHQTEEESKNLAFNIVQKSQEQAKQEMETARFSVDQTKESARLEVDRMIKEAELRVAEIEHEAYQKGYDAGREVGFKKGQAEVRRLIDRLGSILGQAVDTRADIIHSAEKPMLEMILLIARKVIKDEIAGRKDVVLNNIRETLKRVKDRAKVNIRVNFADIDLTTKNKEDLIKTIESLRRIDVYEDSRIERGGCMIDLDGGSIDARISTQLKQIEEAVQNTAPI